MEELRERLTAEISKNEAMAFQMELMNTRLTEINGSVETEVENLGGASLDFGMDLEGKEGAQGKVCCKFFPWKRYRHPWYPEIHC